MQRALIIADATGGVGKSFAVHEFAEAIRNAPVIKFGPPPRTIEPGNGQYKGYA